MFRTCDRAISRYARCLGVVAALIIVTSIAGLAQAAKRQADGLHVRVGAYNVSFCSEASTTEIGKLLKDYDLDIVGLTEVPRAPASSEFAAAIGADYFVVGTISSGESKDKLKAIVSRSPLGPVSEIKCFARGGFVTGGESTTHADTKIAGITISIYCLHISEQVEAMEKLLDDNGFKSDQADAVLVIGDFNAQLVHPQMQMIQDRGFRPSWLDLKMDVKKLKTYDLMPGRGPNGQTRDEGVIDHITYKGAGVKAVDGGIVPAKTSTGAPMSDHAMIWTELVIPVPSAN